MQRKFRFLFAISSPMIQRIPFIRGLRFWTRTPFDVCAHYNHRTIISHQYHSLNSHLIMALTIWMENFELINKGITYVPQTAGVWQRNSVKFTWKLDSTDITCPFPHCFLILKKHSNVTFIKKFLNNLLNEFKLVCSVTAVDFSYYITDICFNGIITK